MNHKQSEESFIGYTNKKKVLHFIKENPGISRAEIAKDFSLSQQLISKIVNALIEEGWIYEVWHEDKNASGRRTSSLSFDHTSQYIIGIDIGGTNVVVAIVDLYGQVVAKTVFSTQEYLGEKFIGQLIESINRLMHTRNLSDSKILGAGIGVPGITDFNQGMVIDAPALGWQDYPLRQMLSERLPYPIYLDNDVNVSVLGEKWQGVAKHQGNIVKVMLGTGIGCGMILNGKLYRGASYAAGEIGYMVTDKTVLTKAYPSVLSGYGFLDNHIGGAAIANQMKKRLGTNQFEGKEITAMQVFELANKKNAQAEKVVTEMIQHLSLALLNVIAVMNPDCIVIGGGVSKSLALYLPEIKAVLQENLPMACDILLSHHEDISVIGAASLLLVEHESIFKLSL